MTLRVSIKQIHDFQKTVYAFYDTHARAKLPWRITITPYRIHVSEIMLQQTQVDRVVPKFNNFIKAFPSYKTLANATDNQVLSAWQGLGYNRRGINVKKAAEIISKQHHGKLSQEATKLQELPGIGPYTAGAIQAFSWNKPVVFIETNIRTVLMYHFFPDHISGAANIKVSDAELLHIVKKTLDTHNPRIWYWALMDYGSFLKKSGVRTNQHNKHYVKQTTYKGSNREKRSRILSFLLTQKASPEIISNKLSIPLKTVQKNLGAMKKEGLVKEKNGKFFV